MSLRKHPGPTVSEADVRRAWQRYLRETREAGPDEYDRVEGAAWLRLTSNLTALGASAPDRETSRDNVETVR